MRSGLSGADMMFLDLDVRSEVVVSGVVRILFLFFCICIGVTVRVRVLAMVHTVHVWFIA